ncbi:MAG: helix-turn-helix transcriptional regulator [Caldilineaceae bacterium]|nr:helix-turn-helix transcriptional regulator [Caldilineaceae bacterium]
MESTSRHTPNQPLDPLTHWVGGNLQEAVDGAALAEAAHYSRFHFLRLFRARTGETPVDCRRRLLLERAGYQLRHTTQPITAIAWEAHFDSLEGFSRAFRKAFGVSPSHYRRLEPLSWLLAAPNDIHYDPVVGAAMRLAQTRTQGGKMDLTDRLIEHDLWLTRRLLAAASTLTDAQLDAPLPQPEHPVTFEAPEKTLREVLTRMVFTKEVWVAAIQGRPLPDATDASIARLQQRMEAAYGEFKALVQQVGQQALWDTEFVDMLCEPPETFTYGGMIAHVVTFAAYRRTAALRAFAGLGVTTLGYGDPIEWEMSLIP